VEKAKSEKEAHGEFESECPEYCGAQDTFYVGNMKGVGRIDQQTFIDTYARSPSPSSMTARRLSPQALPCSDGSRHRNIAAIQNTTNTNSIWRSRISTIRAPRPRARKRLM
jgi:hypothetical protein